MHSGQQKTGNKYNSWRSLIVSHGLQEQKLLELEEEGGESARDLVHEPFLPAKLYIKTL